MADHTSGKGGSRHSEEKTHIPLGLPSPPILRQPIGLTHESHMLAVKDIFSDCSDVVFRNVMISPEVQGVIVYIEGIVNSTDIQEHMLRPLIRGLVEQRTNELEAPLDDTRVALSQVKKVATWAEAADGVLESSALLLMNGSKEAWLFNVKGGVRRGVEEPQTESVIRGHGKDSRRHYV